MKSELRHRDEMINSLQHELKIIKNQQDALINGNGQVYDKETEIRKLKNELLDYKSKFDLLNDDVILFFSYNHFHDVKFIFKFLDLI